MRFATIRLFLLCCAFALGLAGGAYAQSNTEILKRQITNIVFTELEKQIMEEFYGGRRDGNDREREYRDRDYGDRQGRDDDRRGKVKKAKKKHKGRGRNKGMPPGLAKKKRLPPGLARQLERNGKLPPGLAKRDLPQRLDTSLPDPWPGTERKVVGNDVILLEKGTDLILDVLRDVILR